MRPVLVGRKTHPVFGALMAGENKIETYLVDEVKGRAGIIYKLKFIQTNGAPDRLVWIPAWSVGCFVEVKDEGKDLEAHQERRHKELRLMGFKTVLVNSKSAVDALMRRRF